MFLRNKLFYLLICCFCFVCLSAQTDTSSIKYSRFTYPNGVLCSEGMMRNGIPDGVWKNYHPNGVLKSVGRRLNLQLDSIWVFYDERGLLTERISYQNGKKNGYAWHYKIVEQRKTYRSILQSKELFVDNKREGTAWQYTDDSKPELSIPFVSDKKEGIGFGFNKDSCVVALYRYHNNELLSIETVNRRDSLNNKQGVWKTFYPDGSTQSEMLFEGGKLSGYQKEYDRYGRTVRSTLYQRDSVIQTNDTSFTEPIEQITSYSSGEIKSRGTWRFGIAIGVHRQYSIKGQVVSAQMFDNNGCLLERGIIDDKGRRQAQFTLYDSEIERKIAQGQFKNNERVGEWTFYFPDGSIEQQGEYVNGLRNGVWLWYFEGKKVRRRQEFVAGKSEGLYQEYDSAGVSIAEGMFVDDKKDGVWIVRCGRFTEHGAYRDGEKNGVWTGFYENQQIAYRGQFALGRPHGKHFFYFENGTLEHYERYRYGTRVKKWFYYNAHNQLYIIVAYKNGLEKHTIFFDKTN